MTTSNIIGRTERQCKVKMMLQNAQYPLALKFHNNMKITNNKNAAPDLPEHSRDLVFQLPFGVKHKPQYCFPARDRKKLVSFFCNYCVTVETVLEYLICVRLGSV